MFRFLPVLLLAACAPADDDAQTLGGELDTSDTAADTASVPPSGPVAHVAESACVHGAVVELDLETSSPLTYQVEVKYASGVWEPMQPDVRNRPSLITVNAGDQQYESPLYRVGSLLTFTCGYQWEAERGPMIEGEYAGTAVAYRVAWITL